MQFPISGSVQLFGSIAMLLLGYVFFKYGKKDNNKIAEFFGYSLLLIATSRFFLSIPSLFFLKDQKFWLISEVMQRSFQVAGLSILGYIVYLNKFPKHIKKILLFFISLSIIIILGFALFPATYYLTDQGIMTWKNTPVIPSILNFLFILIVIIPAIILFFRQARLSNVRKVKIRSIAMGLALIWIVVPAIIVFFILPFFKIAPIINEINYLFFYLLLLATAFLSSIFE